MQSSNNLIQGARIIRKLQQPNNLKDVIIKLENKEKDGEIFSLVINGKGEVDYNTKNTGAAPGNKISNISEKQFKGLVNKFIDAYFFSFKDNYIMESDSDGSYSIISLRAGDLSKQVKYNKNSRLPQQIRMLEQAIIYTAGTRK